MEIYWARILGVFLAICFLFLVFTLVRLKKLSEEYSVFWSILGVIILVLSLWKEVLIRITALLDFSLPIFTVFFLGLFLLLCLSLYFSVKLSQMQRKLNKLAQELALRNIREIDRQPDRQSDVNSGTHVEEK